MTDATDTGGSTLRARAILDLDGTPKVVEFDAVTVNTDDPESFVVALADASGRTLTLVLPRQEVKKLLNWRTLMTL